MVHIHPLEEYVQRYKGWFVYSVVPGFTGGRIKLYKEASIVEQLKGKPRQNTYLDTPSFSVSEYWGANEPKYWTEGLYKIARDYIDGGAKEAIEIGYHAIDLDTSTEEN